MCNGNEIFKAVHIRWIMRCPKTFAAFVIIFVTESNDKPIGVKYMYWYFCPYMQKLKVSNGPVHFKDPHPRHMLEYVRGRVVIGESPMKVYWLYVHCSEKKLVCIISILM